MNIGDKISIAIVDDSELHRLLLRNMLTQCGYQVVCEAMNGVDILNKVKTGTHSIPNICLLDVEMPEMNGLDTAKELKSYLPDLKILAYSSNEEENIMIEMLRNGADGYLIKGSTIHTLKNAIKSVLEQGYYFDETLCKGILNYLRYSVA